MHLQKMHQYHLGIARVGSNPAVSVFLLFGFACHVCPTLLFGFPRFKLPQRLRARSYDITHSSREKFHLGTEAVKVA